jgi:antitoxin component YwqK of YwqJK toxin-antitoxin module
MEELKKVTQSEYNTGRKVAEYYENKKGNTEGIFRSWHQTGALFLEVEYKDGVIDGRYKKYFDKKNIDEEANYKNGKLEGIRTKWYISGQKYEESTYKDAKLDGTSKFWYPNGILSQESDWHQGFPHGRYLSYSETTGKMISEGQYYYSASIGKHFEYYDNGQKKSEKEYPKAGVLEGKCIYWFPTGLPHTALSACPVIQKIYDCVDNKVTRVISLKDDMGEEHVLPEGEIVVWKACRHMNSNTEVVFVYVMILVPAEAKRVTVVDTRKIYKSRISFGRVIDIEDEKGNKYDDAHSYVYSGRSIKYERNKMVYPNSFDPDPNNECSFGISCHRYKNQCIILKV